MRHGTRPAHGRTLAVAGGAAALVLLAATGAQAEGKGDVRVTKAVANGGDNVIVGTSKTIRFPVAITVRDNSGVKGLTRVSTFYAYSAEGGGFADWTGATCKKKSSTTSVCTAEPWVNGLTPNCSHSGFRYTSRSTPNSATSLSRKVYISWNFHVVSTWSSGNGGLAG